MLFQGVFEKIEKLRKVRADLLENEHRLVDLLQRVSVSDYML